MKPKQKKTIYSLNMSGGGLQSMSLGINKATHDISQWITSIISKRLVTTGFDNGF